MGRWLSSFIRVHDSPRSVDLKIPPSPASTTAITSAGLRVETARPMRPLSPSGRPSVNSRQLSPPSVLSEDPAPGPAPDEPPRATLALVGGCVEGGGVGGVDGEIHDARVFVDVEDPLPGGAAVGGAIDAAFLIRAEEVPERGDPHRAGVGGMHDDPADVPRLFQPGQPPGLAAVLGVVDALSPRRNCCGCSARPFRPTPAWGPTGPAQCRRRTGWAGRRRTDVQVVPWLTLTHTPPDAAPR